MLLDMGAETTFGDSEPIHEYVSLEALLRYLTEKKP